MLSALIESFFSKLSKVSSDKTTPQPNVSAGLFLSITMTSVLGFCNFMEIAKYKPPGPPPIQAIFIRNYKIYKLSYL